MEDQLSNYIECREANRVKIGHEKVTGLGTNEVDTFFYLEQKRFDQVTSEEIAPVKVGLSIQELQNVEDGLKLRIQNVRAAKEDLEDYISGLK